MDVENQHWTGQIGPRLSMDKQRSLREFEDMTVERRSLSGMSAPDEVALWVGRFVMYFGYLEFELWLWYNEIFDDQEKAVKFVEKILTGKAGSIKGSLEKLPLSKPDRVSLLAFIDQVIALAASRNLVCHNPYISPGGREGEVVDGAIFGIRSATINPSNPIQEAKLADIRRFADDASQLCRESHKLFQILQAALPPKK
jgi:hypothetical protein